MTWLYCVKNKPTVQTRHKGIPAETRVCTQVKKSYVVDKWSVKAYRGGSAEGLDILPDLTRKFRTHLGIVSINNQKFEGSDESSLGRIATSKISQAWLPERKNKKLTAGQRSLDANIALFYVPGVRVLKVQRWNKGQGLLRTVRINYTTIESFPDKSLLLPTLESINK